MTVITDTDEGEGSIKAGARNSASDLVRIQGIHDLAVELGATCGDADEVEDEYEAESDVEEQKAITPLDAFKSFVGDKVSFTPVLVEDTYALVAGKSGLTYRLAYAGEDDSGQPLFGEPEPVILSATPVKGLNGGLMERYRAVSSAWQKEFIGPGVQSDPTMWDTEVTETHVIVTKAGQLWAYPYSTDEANTEFRFGDPFMVRVEYTPVENAKSIDLEGVENMLVNYGSAVKALSSSSADVGIVGGYLVRFSTATDPDMTKQADFFRPPGETDYDVDFTTSVKSTVYFAHGLDNTLGKTKIGVKGADGIPVKATLGVDEVGVWIKHQLDLRDAYEKAIYEMTTAGKMGWSSGTATHLVTRKQVGGAHQILHWPLGLDASLTPIPAEPRAQAISLKQLYIDLAATKAQGDSYEDADASGIAESALHIAALASEHLAKLNLED